MVSGTATLYLMVGIPGAGKTTWAKCHTEWHYIGSDEIRAKLFGKELTLRGYRKVHRLMMEQALALLAAGQDVVLDSSHLTRRARRKVLQALPPGVGRVAVYIDTKVPQALRNNRNRQRHVPRLGILYFGRRIVPPTTAEGFDRILYVADPAGQRHSPSHSVQIQTF